MGQADEAAAQLARAEALRAQIARIAGKTKAEPRVGDSPTPSPREFIEEKMRELRDAEHKSGE